MFDQDPIADASRGFGCMILVVIALVAAMMIILALPYLLALVEWVLVGGEAAD
ncbi:hypothetical protein [Streptomyces sp. NPDC026673]|uniref:hypothetical protein n=1 Tax=Streptomyces sp. NPDC026673 TaxID=3155724 RepID=UPI0033C39ECA